LLLQKIPFINRYTYKQNNNTKNDKMKIGLISEINLNESNQYAPINLDYMHFVASYLSKNNDIFLFPWKEVKEDNTVQRYINNDIQLVNKKLNLKELNVFCQ
jgi:hypothetical protein